VSPVGRAARHEWWIARSLHQGPHGASLTHRARSADAFGSPAVTCSCALFTQHAHGAVGVAKRPAFRAPSSEGSKEQHEGAPRRRPNNTGSEALAKPLSLRPPLSPCGPALSAVVPAQAGTQSNLWPGEGKQRSARRAAQANIITSAVLVGEAGGGGG
jgi:hypothetical protein